MTRGLVDPDAVRRVSRTMALRKVARPEDVAAQVVVLASDILSGHVTGQVVTVAGGMEGRTIHERVRPSVDMTRELGAKPERTESSQIPGLAAAKRTPSGVSTAGPAQGGSRPCAKRRVWPGPDPNPCMWGSDCRQSPSGALFVSAPCHAA